VLRTISYIKGPFFDILTAKSCIYVILASPFCYLQMPSHLSYLIWKVFIKIRRALPVLVKAGRNNEHITRRPTVRAFLHAFQTYLAQTVTGAKIFSGEKCRRNEKRILNVQVHFFLVFKDLNVVKQIKRTYQNCYLVHTLPHFVHCNYIIASFMLFAVLRCNIIMHYKPTKCSF
jgi:hypothetical protein